MRQLGPPGSNPKPFDITDTSRKTVLKVAVADDHSPTKPKFTLRAENGILLAQFGVSPRDAGGSECTDFALMQREGELFARLKRTEGQERYVLKTPDKRLYFWGAFAQRAVNVTDNDGRLLASTEPASEVVQGYLLKVAPLMDAGLVLCGLLCIEHVIKR
mmetsp:Transcript_54925/g.152326  ORF Transcript_54925/g.152326 Transcript_54925/m.152326 type:complete len:160 (-) Transcript_54925:98-577(-)